LAVSKATRIYTMQFRWTLKATPKVPFSLLTVPDVNDMFCECLLGDFSFLHKQKFKAKFC